MNKHADTHRSQLLKISEFARETDLSPRTLRLYEEQGLLTPKARSVGGFRFYSLEQRKRLHYIQKLKDFLM